MDAANSNIKLINCCIPIFDKDNKEVENLTADENDKAISEPLYFGKFTLEEIQAPNRSTLFKDLIEGKVLSSVQK